MLIRFAGFNTGQNFYAVINIVNRVNMKFSFVNSIQDVFAQHQVLYVGTGDNHALVSGETAMTANIKESFNLFINAANGLDFTKLVNRTGNGNVLFNREICYCRKHTVIFGRRSTVSVNAAVRLFKNNRGAQ